MQATASVNHSGNAHVNVVVDTRPIAFAMLSCLHATGRFSDNEMNDMVGQFQSLSNSDGGTRFYHGENRLENIRLFHDE